MSCERGNGDEAATDKVGSGVGTSTGAAPSVENCSADGAGPSALRLALRWPFGPSLALRWPFAGPSWALRPFAGPSPFRWPFVYKAHQSDELRSLSGAAGCPMRGPNDGAKQNAPKQCKHLCTTTQHDSTLSIAFPRLFCFRFLTASPLSCLHIIMARPCCMPSAKTGTARVSFRCPQLAGLRYR